MGVYKPISSAASKTTLIQSQNSGGWPTVILHTCANSWHIVNIIIPIKEEEEQCYQFIRWYSYKSDQKNKSTNSLSKEPPGR